MSSDLASFHDHGEAIKGQLSQQLEESLSHHSVAQPRSPFLLELSQQLENAGELVSDAPVVGDSPSVPVVTETVDYGPLFGASPKRPARRRSQAAARDQLAPKHPRMYTPIAPRMMLLTDDGAFRELITAQEIFTLGDEQLDLRQDVGRALDSLTNVPASRSQSTGPSQVVSQLSLAGP